VRRAEPIAIDAPKGLCSSYAAVHQQSVKMASKTSRSSLGREIALVLALKFLALFVIWSVWFAHPEAGRLTSQLVAAAIYSSPAIAQDGSRADAKP
jgi:hypothetical protein